MASISNISKNKISKLATLYAVDYTLVRNNISLYYWTSANVSVLDRISERLSLRHGANCYVYWGEPTSVRCHQSIPQCRISIACYDGEKAGSDSENCCRNIIERILLSGVQQSTVYFLCARMPYSLYHVHWCDVFDWVAHNYVWFRDQKSICSCRGIVFCLSAYLVATSCPASYSRHDNRTQTAGEGDDYSGLKSHLNSLAPQHSLKLLCPMVKVEINPHICLRRPNYLIIQARI